MSGTAAVGRKYIFINRYLISVFDFYDISFTFWVLAVLRRQRPILSWSEYIYF